MIAKWTVTTTKAVDKQTAKLSKKIIFVLRLLFEDLVNRGPTYQIGQIIVNCTAKRVKIDVIAIYKKEDLLMFAAGKL